MDDLAKFLFAGAGVCLVFAVLAWLSDRGDF